MDRAGNRRRPCGPCAVPKPRAELRACRAAGLSCDGCRTLQRLRHLLARLPRRLNSGRRRKGRTPRYGRPRLQRVPCLHPRLPQRSHCPAHGRSHPPKPATATSTFHCRRSWRLTGGNKTTPVSPHSLCLNAALRAQELQIISKVVEIHTIRIHVQCRNVKLRVGSEQHRFIVNNRKKRAIRDAQI